MGLTIHYHQVKINNYPKTRKLTSPGENVYFFVLGCYKILKLMNVCRAPYKEIKFIFFLNMGI
ncbi:hypothetical protein CN543_01730 [Bacillus toyonensis]|nr:hypothetical protein CN543_01730 [Bacillus toyonensis]PEO07606.1 hypothetical protein CN561_00985 [Bacillus toyonensis]